MRQTTLVMALLAFGGPACGVVVDAESYVDGQADPARAHFALLGGVRQAEFGDPAATSEVLVALAGESGKVGRYLPMDALPKAGVFSGYSSSSGVTALGSTGEPSLLLARAEHSGAGLGPWRSLGVVAGSGVVQPMLAMLGENLFAVLGGHADGGDGSPSVKAGHITETGINFPDGRAHDLARPRWLAAAGVCRSFLYVVGGLSGPSGSPTTIDSVEVAALPSDDLGPFAETLPMALAGAPHGVAGAALACHAATLFVVGGTRERGVNQTVTTVLAGRIEATGQISSWTELEPLPAPLANAAAVVAGGQLWVIGGTLDGGLTRSDRVHSAPLEGDRLGPWTSSGPGLLPDGRSDTAVIAL